jgi:dinuclear metal center YbgI/SA1388 family protein
MHFFILGAPMKATVGDILEAVDELAPWDLAEEWDNAGLQMGRRGQSVGRILIALDSGETEIRRALSGGANLLLTHHPLLFHPVTRLDGDRTVGRLAGLAAGGSLAVVAAHTNLDAASGGLADHAASRLGLGEVHPLSPPVRPGYLKLVTFAPPEAVEGILESLRKAGAGAIGAYRGCFFTTLGEGRFEPLPDARPMIGRVRKRALVPEVRIETRIPGRLAPAAVEAIRAAHPYETPEMDLCPLAGPEEGVGIGRVGTRPATKAAQFVDLVRIAFPGAQLRGVGRPPRRIRRVAVIPGSGGAHVAEAGAKGADVLVTGEIRYHQALEAQALGLWVIEAGHRATEAAAVTLLARHIRRYSGLKGWDIEVTTFHVREAVHASL